MLFFTKYSQRRIHFYFHRTVDILKWKQTISRKPETIYFFTLLQNKSILNSVAFFLWTSWQLIQLNSIDPKQQEDLQWWCETRGSFVLQWHKPWTRILCCGRMVLRQQEPSYLERSVLSLDRTVLTGATEDPNPNLRLKIIPSSFT